VVAPTAVKSKRPQDKTGMLVPAASSPRQEHVDKCRVLLASCALQRQDAPNRSLSAAAAAETDSLGRGASS